MIAYIKGAVIHKDQNFIILDQQGLGFRIFLSAALLLPLKEGETVAFFTHEYLRDNERELYGFRDIFELKLFWKLLTVSGVGPKMALHLLDLGYEKLQKAIEAENLGIISSVSGVGKKTAQKIILELRGKLKMGGGREQKEKDIYTALTNLGYSQDEVRETLSHLPSELEKIEDQIKAALKLLSKK